MEKTAAPLVRFVVRTGGPPPGVNLEVHAVSAESGTRLLRVPHTTPGARCLGAYLAAHGIRAWEYHSEKLKGLWHPAIVAAHAAALAPEAAHG